MNEFYYSNIVSKITLLYDKWEQCNACNDYDRMNYMYFLVLVHNKIDYISMINRFLIKMAMF